MTTPIIINIINHQFVNNRIRYWKPKFEALQKKQLKKNPSQQLDDEEQEKSVPEVHPEEEHGDDDYHDDGETTTLQSTSKEGYIPSTSSDKVNTKRISLSLVSAYDNASSTTAVVSPAATGRYLIQQQVSDASIITNESIDDDDSSSSASLDSSGMKKRRRSSFDDVVNFNSPPRRSSVNNKRSRFTDQSAVDWISPTSSRFVEKNVEQWKHACLTSPRLDDQSLPTLDEAVCLFGYSA